MSQIDGDCTNMTYNPTYTWNDEIESGVKITPKRLKIDWDWKFFAIIPALNINIHSLDLEFEWLFLGVYWNFWKKKEQIWINTPFELFWKKEKTVAVGFTQDEEIHKMD